MPHQYEAPRPDIYAISISNTSPWPPRFHTSLELELVLDGFTEVSICGQSIRLEPGDIYVVFPNLLHSVVAQSGRKTLLMVHPSMLPAFRKLISETRPSFPVIKAADVPSVVRPLLSRCTELYRTKDNTAALQAHVNSILSELLPKLPTVPRTNTDDAAQRIAEYIMTNYAQSISITQMSKALGYSQYYVSHVISRTFGCNFRTLLNNYRIHAAQEMLLHTQKNVSQILYDCGFQTQSAFNRAFLLCCGMTPTQCRRTNRNANQLP